MQRRVFLSFILFILRLKVFSHTWNCPGSHGNVRSSVAVPERSRNKPEAHAHVVCLRERRDSRMIHEFFQIVDELRQT